MAIEFSCACGRRIRAKDGAAGLKLVCPGCGRLVTVPADVPPVLTAIVVDDQETEPPPLPSPVPKPPRVKAQRVAGTAWLDIFLILIAALCVFWIVGFPFAAVAEYNRALSDTDGARFNATGEWLHRSVQTSWICLTVALAGLACSRRRE